MATSQTSEVMLHLRRTVLLRDGAGLTDEQLLQEYLSRREEAALAALVRRHGPMVWGVCCRVLPHYHDAEDAFQATFLVLVRKAASIASPELLANWLYGVARQTALKARATTAKRSARERQVTEMPEPAVTEQDLWHDLQPLLDQELSRLPDKYRIAIVLCDLEGKTRKEAARQLGVPDGTLAAWVARGRVMLAKRLARHGLAVTSGSLTAVLAQNAASASAPTSAVSSTIKAADLFAACQAAAGVISVKAAALTEGVLKTMLLTRLKTMTGVLLLLGLIVFGAGLAARNPSDVTDQSQPSKPPAQEYKVLPGFAFDLTKIDRTIRKEPAYRGKPRYALLVLGPKAETRIWLVIDDKTLYVDRNGNGDLTERGEQVAGKTPVSPDILEFHADEIIEADGKTKHSDLIVYQYYARQYDYLVNTVGVTDAVGTIAQTTNGENGCSFGATPKDAPIIHINGLLTMKVHSVWVEDRGGKALKVFSSQLNDLVDFPSGPRSGINEVPYKLKAGEKIGTLNVQVGTPGIGKGTFAALAIEKKFPADVFPVAEICFSSRTDPQGTVKKEFILKDHHDGTQYCGPVQVPDASSNGKFKVTLSFPALKEGKVAPAVVELPMINVPNPEK